MAVFYTILRMSFVLLCGFSTISTTKAEYAVSDHDNHFMEQQDESMDGPHQRIIMNRQKQLMKMEPLQDRREELMEGHTRMMGNMPMKLHGGMVIDHDKMERHNEIIEEHQNFLLNHANIMKNRPEDEESPNPGEPVTP